MAKTRSLQEAVNRVARASLRVRRAKVLREIEQDLTGRMATAFLIQGRMFLRLFASLKNKFPQSSGEAITAWEPLFDEIAGTTRPMLERSMEKAAMLALSVGANTTIERIRDSRVVEAAPKRVRGELGQVATFNLEHPKAVSFLERVGADRVTQVNTETKSVIRGILVESAQEGKSYSETAKQITDRFGQFAIGKPQQHIDSRAHLVAVTETANAYCEGELQVIGQLEEQGLVYEMHWSTMGDANVSDGCQANEAAGWIRMDDLFPSGDNRPPRFPGCRCDLEFQRVEEKKPEKPGEMPPSPKLKPEGELKPEPKPKVDYPMVSDETPADRRKVIEWAEKRKMTVEQYDYEVSNRLKQINDAADPVVRVPDESVLQKILDDGRFKSQFESGTSTGLFEPTMRADVEKALFGASEELAANKRPIYGMLMDTTNMNQGKAYGNVVIKLDRAAIQNRTTMTYGDSLAATAKPRLLSAPDMNCITSGGWGSEMQRGLDPLGWLDNAAKYAASEGEKVGLTHVVSSYAEIQVHGGLSTKDIAEVVFQSPRRGYVVSSKTIDALTKAGIRWSIAP